MEGWLNKLEKMTKDGYHHMKWELHDEIHSKHFELLEKVIARHPETKPIMAAVLAHGIKGVFDDIWELSKFDLADARYKLTNKRADFIIKMLEYRYNYAKKLLNI